MPKKMDRADLRVSERRARYILSRRCSDELAVSIAKDVLRVAENLDNLWAEIFPVFESVQAQFEKKHASICYDGNEFVLVSASGKVISRGPTFREWLINHATTYTDAVVLPPDPSLE